MEMLLLGPGRFFLTHPLLNVSKSAIEWPEQVFDTLMRL